MGLAPFVRRGLVTLPVELRSPPSLTLHTARYDEVHLPAGASILSLAEDERLAALAYVGCRNTGLMCPFLVVTTRESLTIGKLDVESSTWEATGTISLPQGDEECRRCWLVDGPTVVAWYPSRLVVASERQERSVPYLEFARHGSPKWKAETLESSFQQVFVAGNQVLCVSSGNSSPKSVRSADLLSFSLPSDTQVGCYSPSLTKAPLPVELDPRLITCVGHAGSALNVPYQVVYGTSDGGLKCCAHEKVVMEVILEDSPLSVTFAAAAHGEAVMVVTLGGMNRKVVTLFAESLRRISSWTGVHQVVVDDLARLGHDQMLLITQPPSSPAPFERSIRVSLLESGPQSASEEQKRKILKSVNEALERRFQDGVKELQAAEERRLDKMRMLTAACNLMQGIAVGNTSFPVDALSLESVELQETYLGRCFLVINVHTQLPEGAHLRRPTLFATSLNGFVKSMVSSLPSQGNAQRFLFSVPLKECHFPLHIIFAGEITLKNSECVSAWDPEEANFKSRSPRLYTQWIHSMDISNLEADITGPLKSPTLVCEQWLSRMGDALSQDLLSALVTAVSLQTNSGKQTVTEEEEEALTSMYAHDVSVVKKSTNSLEVHGPKVLEMMIHFADVMLGEIRSSANDESSISIAELQAATDRSFCHMLSSITHGSFGHSDAMRQKR